MTPSRFIQIPGTDETNVVTEEADPALFARYRLIRDEIAHEDSVMGARLSWFMASQSFLLTALAIAQGGQLTLPTPALNYLFPLLPIVAIASSAVIFAGVLAGITTLRRWRRMLDRHYPQTIALPRVRRDERITTLSWSGPVCLPLIFIVAWTYLLVAGLWAWETKRSGPVRGQDGANSTGSTWESGKR